MARRKAPRILDVFLDQLLADIDPKTVTCHGFVIQ